MRLLGLDESHAQALKDAAEFCNKLAAIEYAHLLENTDEIDYLLSNVDPIEARNVAWTITTLWQLYNVLPEDRGGPAPVAARIDSPDDGREPAAPIPFPGHSVKA